MGVYQGWGEWKEQNIQKLLTRKEDIIMNGDIK